jgi:hypothetical protein
MPGLHSECQWHARRRITEFYEKHELNQSPDRICDCVISELAVLSCSDLHASCSKTVLGLTTKRVNLHAKLTWIHRPQPTSKQRIRRGESSVHTAQCWDVFDIMFQLLPLDNLVNHQASASSISDYLK